MTDTRMDSDEQIEALVTDLNDPDLLENPTTISLSEECSSCLKLFYALVFTGDESGRALEMTSRVIECNSSSYTAWFWRKRCLVASPDLITLLIQEVEFLDNWCCRNPKNYQIWYHRRWLIDQLADRKLIPAEQLRVAELQATDKLIELEPKHYNAWSHRIFIAAKFGLFDTDSEIDFTTKFISLDVRNNSAWNHRRYAMRSHPHRYESELSFCMNKIRAAPDNESPWVYLRSLPGWEQNGELENLCQNLLISTNDPKSGVVFRDAIETLARIYEFRGDIANMTSVLSLIAKKDFVRRCFFDDYIARSKKESASAYDS